MKQSIINQAKTDYVDKMENSPTKAVRWAAGWEGLMQTSNEMSLVAIAHKISENETDKKYFEKGLYAEAEWTLGRNPLGLVQMTGLTDRCFTQTFAPGRQRWISGINTRDGHLICAAMDGCVAMTILLPAIGTQQEIILLIKKFGRGASISGTVAIVCQVEKQRRIKLFGRKLYFMVICLLWEIKNK